MRTRTKKCKHTIFDNACPSCQALKDKWYGKLDKDEFNDIESDEDNLKVWSSFLFGKNRAGSQFGGWQFKAEYYYMASQFLEQYKFDNNRDKIIWDYHSNGISIAEIAKTLKKVKIKTTINIVQKTIIRLKLKMYDMYMVSTGQTFRE